MAESNAIALRLVNASGFLFQLVVETQITSSMSHHGWEVDGRVLGEPPINSPLAAMRAAIVAEHQERNRETK